MFNGLFVVLEGGDYSGKGEQTKRLHNLFVDFSEDNAILTEHEPTGRAKKIKENLAADLDPYSKAVEMTSLYIDDRDFHTRMDIAPALERGKIVIENRYKMSTCAYQWAQGISLEELFKLHDEKFILIPDITYVLDITPETATRRSKNDGVTRDKFERLEEFRNRVYLNYRTLTGMAQQDLSLFGKVELIDGNNGQDQVTADIMKTLKPIYDEWILEQA